MKAQSFQVRNLKNQIAACLRLIASKVKSAVLRLLDLEEKLEVAMSEQILDGSKEFKLDLYQETWFKALSPEDQKQCAEEFQQAALENKWASYDFVDRRYIYVRNLPKAVQVTKKWLEKSKLS